MSVASANNLTIPLASSVNFAIGTQVNVAQQGVGQTTINPTSGVTLRSSAGLKLRTQYSIATCVKVAADEWYITGDTVA
jgi:hypothetical protein